MGGKSPENQDFLMTLMTHDLNDTHTSNFLLNTLKTRNITFITLYIHFVHLESPTPKRTYKI